MDQLNDIIERVKDLKTTIMGMIVMAGAAANDMGYSIEIPPDKMKTLLWIAVGIGLILCGGKKKAAKKEETVNGD